MPRPWLNIYCHFIDKFRHGYDIILNKRVRLYELAEKFALEKL